jgi:hypothetical protein
VFLLFGRLLCLAAFAVVLVVFFTSIPAYLSYLQQNGNIKIDYLQNRQYIRLA